MICMISNNDSQLQAIAAKTATKNKTVFGEWFEVFDQAMPKLKPTEDLFLIASSSSQDERGHAVIGDEENELFLNGEDVWDSIKDIFPKNYTGNVYVCVHEASESDPFVFNFIENFWDQISPVFPNTQVFCTNRSVKGLIPLPTENVWESTWVPDQPTVVSPVSNGRTRTGTFSSRKFTSYAKPIPNPQLTQAIKYFSFNETGNIMMVTTDSDSTFMDHHVREAFNQVSVFWAAMTRGICQTTDPITNMPYSIYDYEAINRIVTSCGHFVPLTQEVVQIRSNNWGEQFSEEMVSSLLGVPTGAGELNFAHALICSMGNAAWNMSRSSARKDVRVGTVVFVCECLLGIPSVSAIVLHADMAENSRSFRMGPCTNRSNTTSTWNIKKDKYMFVTPSFISEYAGDLRTASAHSDYNDLVGFISNLVTSQTHINAVTTSGINPIVAPRILMPNTEYLMTGENFGEREGTIRLGTEPVTIRAWSNNTVKFVTPNDPVSEVQIDVFTHGNWNDPVACTTESYSVGAIREAVMNN